MTPEVQQTAAAAPAGAGTVPEEVIFTLSYKCNLRCRTCYLFLKDGQHVAPQIHDDLPAERWMQLVDEVASFSPRVFFVGGEPLVFKGILPLVEHSKRRSLFTYLCTNGTMLKHVAEPLVATGIDRIDVSLDGLAETHDWIRGEGVFRRTMAGLQALLAAREQQGRRNELRVGLAVLMCHHNVEHLVPLREMARELGLDFVKYQYMMFNEVPNIVADRELFAATFGVQSTVMEGYVDILEQGLDVERLCVAITELRQTAGPPEVIFTPDVPDPRHYYTELGHVFPVQRCEFPDRVARILPNGDVPVCFGHPDFPVGNVREHGLLEIFQGPQQQRFRAELANRGLFPGCLRCSQRRYV